MSPALSIPSLAPASPVRAAAAARITLLFWLVIALATVLVASLSRDGRQRPVGPTGSDVDLYRAIVDRVHSGQGYYSAQRAELVARGYPTRSMFNWRMPVPLIVLGHLPHPVWGKVLLGGLGLALVLTTFTALMDVDRVGPWQALAAICLLGGPLWLAMLGDIYLMPMVWAGVLIGLSLAAYGVRRPSLGALAGIAALLARELALPYCLAGLVLALAARRRRESAVWLAGILTWAVLLVLHAMQVANYRPPDATAHPHGWICFGGLPLLVSMTQSNGFLLLLPRAVSGLYLVAALLGFSRWTSAWGQRVGLTAALYILAFAIVGQEFNQYWGCVISPVLALGVAASPRALRDLLQAARAAAAKARRDPKLWPVS